MPPTVVLHGGLLDQRMLRLKRDSATWHGREASLGPPRPAPAADASRGSSGSGRSELLARLRAHEAVPADTAPR